MEELGRNRHTKRVSGADAAAAVRTPTESMGVGGKKMINGDFLDKFYDWLKEGNASWALDTNTIRQKKL
jgi:hypothetical protein